MPGTGFCEAGAKYLNFTSKKMEALRGWVIYTLTYTWWVEGPYLRTRSLFSKGSYLAGRRSRSHPHGSRTKTPDSAEVPGVSHLCAFLLSWAVKLSCFPFPKPICLLYFCPVTISPFGSVSSSFESCPVSFRSIPINPHVQHSSCCGEMHLFCAFFEEKNYPHIPKYGTNN